MARQISPRPYLAMKLMASGVTLSAARVRSPSFSRSSSSTTTIIRPARISSIAVGTSVKALSAGISSLSGLREILAESYQRPANSLLLTPKHQACDVILLMGFADEASYLSQQPLEHQRSRLPDGEPERLQ